MRKEELIQRLVEVRGDPEIWLETVVQRSDGRDYQIFDTVDHICIDDDGDLVIRGEEAVLLEEDLEEEDTCVS